MEVCMSGGLTIVWYQGDHANSLIFQLQDAGQMASLSLWLLVSHANHPVVTLRVSHPTRELIGIKSDRGQEVFWAVVQVLQQCFDVA